MPRDEATLVEAISKMCGATWNLALDGSTVKLTRPGSAIPSRTLLVRQLRGSCGSAEALRAAAQTRIDLTEPAASALYLLLIADQNVSPDAARALEDDERFCRKYVWRSDEAADAFLRRTFLGLLSLPEPASETEEIGPRARILKRVAEKGGSAKRASVLLDAIVAMPDGLVDPAAWLNSRLANSGDP